MIKEKVIIGYIIDATPKVTHMKSNGKMNEWVDLTIQMRDENVFPQKLAVRCTGWKVNYAPLAGSGQLVRVELEWRVYSCKDKQGNKTTNNDIYAKSIEIFSR